MIKRIVFFMLLYWCCPEFAAYGQLERDSEKLFTLLEPTTTGVHFRNDIQDEKERNILIYDNFYQGSGVGVGDFNNDGLQDIYFGGNISGDKLYINQGNLRFEDITDQAGITDDGSWSSGITLVDINMDGFTDIYVCKELYDNQPTLRKNKLYINQGDLTFKEQADVYGLGDMSRSRHAVFFDYDKDGDPDCFLLNQPPNPGNYSDYYGMDLLQDKFSPRLLQNEGDKFVDRTEVAGLLRPGYCNSVIASDLNNDGWVDLYVSNDFEVPDFFYVNNGDGTFRDVALQNLNHISYFSMGVDVGDINNDGFLDMMVADMSAEDNFRSKANMSGMNPETFWKIEENGGHYQYMYNTLQLSRGDNQYSEIGQLAGVASTDWSWSNFFADFDNDGYQDLFVSNGLLRDVRNSDAKKKFPEYVEKAVRQYITEHPKMGDVSIWDVLDLEQALKILPSQKLENYIYKNNGDLTFSKKTYEWGLNQRTFSHGAAYGDLDNDGDIDIVVNNVNDVASIYRNNSDQRPDKSYLRVEVSSTNTPFTPFGVRVEVMYNGKRQLREVTNVRGMFSTSELICHFGLDGENTVDMVKVLWPDGYTSTLKNVAANQKIVVDKGEARTARNTRTTESQLLQDVTDQRNVAYTHKENTFDDYALQVLLPHKMSTFGPGLATGDVNGDGLTDFYVGGASGQPGALYMQQGNGQFTAADGLHPWLEHSPMEDLDAVFFDSDNDGDLDLYVVSGGNEFVANSILYQDRLYLNDGNGVFSHGISKLPRIAASGSRVKPCDYDQDGDIDLFVGGRLRPGQYPLGGQSLLLQNSDGVFTDVMHELTPGDPDLGMVTDAVWTDYNLDGWKDLIVVGEWMPITMFQNQGGVLRKQVDSDLAHRTGWWFSIEAADFDHDGDEDLIIGNQGLNYKYKASPSEPFSLHYSDFDENGSKDIVLGYYNFGKQFPLRGRSCSSSQIPDLKSKFPSYNQFASATLLEVYGQEELSDAETYAVRGFASVYAENTGNGSFKFRDLPIEAQISPINDIIIQDFNDDTHPDILVAGNLYASEVETPRADAGKGLILLGDGNGQFKVDGMIQNNHLLNKDVKAMAIIKTGTTPLILVANNNDRIQILSRMTE